MKRFAIYRFLLLPFVLSCFIACGSSEKKTQDIKVIELDLLPMYGSTPEYGNLEKNAEQMDADRQFLQNSDKVQPSREQACLDYIEFGWYYLKQGDPDTAMRRANQAWQLDSTNPDTYTLYAAILNTYEAHEEAVDMLDRAINLAPNQLNLYDLYLSESIDLYRQSQDKSNILKFINMLDKIETENDSTQLKVKGLKDDALNFLK